MADLNGVISTLPSGVTGFVNWAVIGFKIFLGLVVLYFVFKLVGLFLNYRKNRMIKEVLTNVKEINSKLGKRSKEDKNK
ncbi:MAG: hypothetical protein WC796_02610 [Candidatus Pacearchaeota archaeon]|jgi:hypothetical protein